ncbi:MAG: DUF4760 domain-containing protein [Clostridium sp.]|nr:DUF4760 domain-containing protein [Clostridium sp.]
MNNTLLENIANFSTFIGLLAVAYQIYMSKKEQRIQHEKQEKQKAIELAELYANKLIHNIGYLCRVFQRCGIQAYFEDIKYHQLKEFDVYELEHLFTKEEMKKINNNMDNIDIEILAEATITLRDKLDENIFSKIVEAKKILKLNRAEIALTNENESEDERNERMRILSKHSYYSIYFDKMFSDILNDTLNTLEYFCMYLNTGIADEDTIYQSLHQSFLSMVKVLYFRIASRNETGKDKYYTNIIELYNKWANKYYENEQKEIENSRCISKKPTLIKK